MLNNYRPLAGRAERVAFFFFFFFPAAGVFHKGLQTRSNQMEAGRQFLWMAVRGTTPFLGEKGFAGLRVSRRWNKKSRGRKFSNWGRLGAVGLLRVPGARKKRSRGSRGDDLEWPPVMELGAGWIGQGPKGWGQPGDLLPRRAHGHGYSLSPEWPNADTAPSNALLNASSGNNAVYTCPHCFTHDCQRVSRSSGGALRREASHRELAFIENDRAPDGSS